MSFLLGIIYLSFISLGLPDALLGAAWPNMYPEFQVPVSYAGAISMIIAFGTIISSLQSDRRNDSSCTVGLFYQSQLCFIVLMGNSLWSWGRLSF